MESISIRDLRNHGGDVLDRVARGETVNVTRDGAAAARLSPLPRRSPSAAELIARRRVLPQVDPMKLRADIDGLLDPTL